MLSVTVTSAIQNKGLCTGTLIVTYNRGAQLGNDFNAYAFFYLYHNNTLEHKNSSPPNITPANKAKSTCGVLYEHP